MAGCFAGADATRDGVLTRASSCHSLKQKWPVLSRQARPRTAPLVHSLSLYSASFFHVENALEHIQGRAKSKDARMRAPR